MQSFFDQVDRIVCINLDRRTDRWAQAQDEFARLGIAGRVQRFSALTETRFANPQQNAVAGLCMTNAAILQQAERDGCRNLLIFEDDVTFLRPPPPIPIPECADLFYLGIYPLRSRFRPCGPFLILEENCYGNQAVIYPRKLFVEASKIMALPPLVADWLLMKHIHCRGASVCLNPPVAFQRDSPSDLRVHNGRGLLACMIRDYNFAAKQFGGQPVKF